MSNQNKTLSFMQGDSFGIEITIQTENGVIAPPDVADVEITIGRIRKTYSNHELSFEGGNGNWVFPLTQEESFQMPSTHVKAQVRVMWPDGTVEGVSLGVINIYESISREVL